MYTVVPKHPEYECEKDPYPFLNTDQNWGLTNDEFKLKYAGGKWKRRREELLLLQEIIKDMGDENEVD